MKHSPGVYLVLLLVTGIQTQNTFMSTGPRPIHKDFLSEESRDSISSAVLLSAGSNRGINKAKHENAKELLNSLPMESLKIPNFQDGDILSSSPFSSSVLPGSNATAEPSSILQTSESLDNSNEIESSNLKKDNNDIELGGDSQEGFEISKLLTSSKETSDQTGLANSVLTSLSSSSQQKAPSTVPLIQLLNSTRTGMIDQTPQDTNISVSKLKPSGLLYVDTVNSHVLQERPMDVRSTSPCPVEHFEDTDVHKLSSSQFGYPRSIVNKALSESNAEIIFDIFEDQLHFFSHQDSPTVHDDDDPISTSNNLITSGLSGRLQSDFPPTKEFRQAPPINFLFQSSLSNNDLQFRKQKNLLTGTDSTFKRENKAAKLSSGSSVQPKPTSDFLSDGQKGIGNISPQLLDDSVFHSKSEQPNIGQRSSDVEPTSTGNDRVDVGTLNALQKTSPFNEDEKTPSLFKPSVDQSHEKPTRFNNHLPDVSGGGPTSWFLSNRNYPTSFTSFDPQPPASYNSNRERFFPPKSSDKFLGFSVSNDFGGSKLDDSFIKYSPDTSSSISSPFQLDTKSLFSTISGVTVEDDKSSSNKKPSNTDAFAFRPTSPMFASTAGTSLQGGSTDKFTGGYQSNRFGTPFKIRRKRQVRREDTVKQRTTTDSTCPVSYELLRQYKNYDGLCFVVKPEIQGIQYATCTNSRCRGCHVDEGNSRCQAVRVPMWVWSYCEQGPQAGKVTADRLVVSVACTCKVSKCPIAGR